MKPDFRKILFDSSKITIEITSKIINEKPECFEDILNLAIANEAPLNMRASRVVETVTDNNPDIFIPFVNKIADIFQNFNTDGQKRSFAYILSKYINNIDEDKQAKMIDICFDYMLSNEKVAVKYYCMKFLFEMTKKYPDLSSELLSVIEFNLAEGIFRMNGEIKKVYKKISSFNF